MSSKLMLTIPWEEIEQGAKEQIEAVMAMDCLKTLAIMPDVHKGYDLPIGGVALLDDHIWPGAVGYDIGCGMCHLNLGQWPDFDAQEAFDRINRMVPVGFNTHKTPNTKLIRFPNAFKVAALNDAVRERASFQFGTLGGGNHFIEIGQNGAGEIGITIHSGSRRPGWLIGDFYMRLTKGPVRIDSELGQAYIQDMRWALEFALGNRRNMMIKCLEAIGAQPILVKNMVNENHNHAVVTEDGILHRKGATPARKGQIGIIPANMRDGVWITKGLGNEDFLYSASHGAGRKMGRKAAERTLDQGDFATQMDGVITPELNGLLDEAPGAYKDIEGVLAAQEGILVDIIDHFKPLAVVKG